MICTVVIVCFALNKSEAATFPSKSCEWWGGIVGAVLTLDLVSLSSRVSSMEPVLLLDFVRTSVHACDSMVPFSSGCNPAVCVGPVFEEIARFRMHTVYIGQAALCSFCSGRFECHCFVCFTMALLAQLTKDRKCLTFYIFNGKKES